MRKSLFIFILISNLVLGNKMTAHASVNAPQCSAVFIFNKSEVEAQIVAIVKTIVQYQVLKEKGISANTYSFQEAIRQLNQLSEQMPETISFYQKKYAELYAQSSKGDSFVKRKTDKENELIQAKEFQDEFNDIMISITTGFENSFVFMKKNGLILTISRDPDFYHFMSQQSNVKKIITNKANTALVVLKNDGTISTWGLQFLDKKITEKDITDVQEIYSNGYNFAALKKDGSVISWGIDNYGNFSIPQNLTHVVSITSNMHAFSALRNDGTVVTWGKMQFGGHLPFSNLSNVKELYSTETGFAALKNDDSVVFWGQGQMGIELTNFNFENIQRVFTSRSSFFLLTKTNSLISIGESLQSKIENLNSKIQIQNFLSNHNSSLILTNDSQVLAFGHKTTLEQISALDLNNIQQIFSNQKSFALLKKDGTILTIGDKINGGNSSDVQNLLYDIVNVIPVKQHGFIAQRKDGKYIIWGQSIKNISNDFIDLEFY